MFSHKKQTLQINPDDPVFHAVYLGKIEIPHTKQPDSVKKAVKALWDRAYIVGPEKLPRVTVALGPAGIYMEDTRPDTKYQFQFHLSQISYCMANKGFKCVFAWVTSESKGHGSNTNGIEHHGSSELESDVKEPKKLRLHAIVCERDDIARAMALLMTAYFNAAYQDHKSKERREIRKQITQEKLEDLENKVAVRRHSDEIDSPSTSSSRSVSLRSSTRSTKSNSSDDFSPIHTMVAKAFGVSPKALSDPDAVAMHHAEEKLRSLRVDPRKITEQGEMESMFKWVSNSEDYFFY